MEIAGYFFTISIVIKCAKYRFIMKWYKNSNGTKRKTLVNAKALSGVFFSYIPLKCSNLFR